MSVMMHYGNYENVWTEFEELPSQTNKVSVLGKTFEPEKVSEIKSDLNTRLWFTYRKNFANIGGGGPSSDQGWGCMLRAGQMMMAETLMRLRFGRDFKWSENDKQEELYINTVELFKDTHQSLLSIQQIALTGATAERRKVGEWFGPNTMAQVLRRISKSEKEILGCTVSVAMDSVVCKEEIFKDMENSQSVLLIVPLRLGLETVNDIYIEPLMEFLSDESCVGIMGGKPNQAHYFVGGQRTENDSWLLYLDPHTTQPSSVSSGNFNFDEFDRSLHTDQMCWMKAKKLDPSLAVGFLFKCPDKFEAWCQMICKRKFIPFGIVEKSASRNVAISSTVIAADSEDSASDYEVLDIQ